MQENRVLPIIDANTGHVQLRLAGRWHQFFVDRPTDLLRLLARSCAPARFDPEHDQLLLTVAANRCPSGRQVAFSLAKFPAAGGITRLDGDGEPLPQAAQAPYRV